uniref:Uncharacterized protein n=1 Tax=Acrobeloides nanus TaxID=290746 RepID=A0A914ECD3_9BILA
MTCPISSMCVKININGQITRSCDGGICALFNIGNKDCKNSDNCNFNMTSAFKENSNAISNLIHPQRLDTQCNICCCNSDGCNFAIGTKAFMTLIVSSLSFLFLVKH